MNERIRELAEQAGFSFKYKTAPDEMNPGHKLKDLKKFAELIVRECIFAVEDAGGINKYHYTKAISKHFGVEE